MDDEYITEVNAFFQPELSRYAPHFNNGELRPAPMDELYGPGAEAARLHPTKYKEFIEKLTPEQAVSFRADSRHNHMLRWADRVAYAYCIYEGWRPTSWSYLTPPSNATSSAARRTSLSIACTSTASGITFAVSRPRRKRSE